MKHWKNVIISIRFIYDYPTNATFLPKYRKRYLHTNLSISNHLNDKFLYNLLHVSFIPYFAVCRSIYRHHIYQQAISQMP